MTDTIDDEDDEIEAPGLTVGELRKALEGVPDHYPVTVRLSTNEGDDNDAGGIVSAAVEDSCGGMHFAIDASDDPEAFDEEE
jgi:hypothetical protein